MLFTIDSHIEKMLRLETKKCTRTRTHTYLQLVSYFWEMKKQNKKKSASKITEQQFTIEAENGLKSQPSDLSQPTMERDGSNGVSLRLGGSW